MIIQASGSISIGAEKIPAEELKADDLSLIKRRCNHRFSGVSKVTVEEIRTGELAVCIYREYMEIR